MAQELGPEELGIWDKGFYKAGALRQVAQRGGYFLVPWPHSVGVYRADGQGQLGPQLEVAAQLRVSSQNMVEWSAVNWAKPRTVGSVRYG